MTEAAGFPDAFYAATHPERMELLEGISPAKARTLFLDERELPEGYRRLINNQFEELLNTCFPDHYCFYKRHNGCYYLEEIYSTLERYKERLEEKATDVPSRRSLKESLESEDYELLIRIIDAISDNDFAMIEDDIPQIKTYLFNDWLDILRFMQYFNIDFLKKMYEIVKEMRLDPKSLREWTIIADDIESLEKEWKQMHHRQSGINWLKFFDEQLKDILSYGTTGAFFSLLQYVANNGVNVVRHGPYLEDLLHTIVSLKRLTLFRQLISEYKISRFDWFALLIPAANTGQIALIEDLMKLEEQNRGFDINVTLFQVMEGSVKNGHFETFIYFFEQCSEEQLKENPSWVQSIISAISWGNYSLFKKLFEHPLFDFQNVRPEISYTETKDDEKIKQCLKSLTPHERLIQKTLSFDLDSKGSFDITLYLLHKYMKDLSSASLMNQTDEKVDFNKPIYLYAFTGRTKQYLNYVGAFLTTETNIRRFFYCFYFSKDELEKIYLPMAEKIHDSEYQTDKDALDLFKRLMEFENYFMSREELPSEMLHFIKAYATEKWSGKEAHREKLAAVVENMEQHEKIPSPKQIYMKAMDAIIASGIKVEETSVLLKVIHMLEAKIGHRLSAVKSLNRKIADYKAPKE